MFFIVWGSKIIEKKLGQGVFFCPDCYKETTYSHIKLQKWFTLYWIPLFPTKTLDTVVKCDKCTTMYKERILDIQAAAAVGN
jgi:hypothetical protein